MTTNELKTAIEALAAEYEAEGNQPVANTLDELANLPRASLETLAGILDKVLN